MSWSICGTGEETRGQPPASIPGRRGQYLTLSYIVCATFSDFFITSELILLPPDKSGWVVKDSVLVKLLHSCKIEQGY